MNEAITDEIYYGISQKARVVWIPGSLETWMNVAHNQGVISSRTYVVQSELENRHW